jgi:hypothetical protein
MALSMMVMQTGLTLMMAAKTKNVTRKRRSKVVEAGQSGVMT